MRSEGYGTCLACVCVCVRIYSRTTCSKTAKKQYQRVQCHTGLILNNWFLWIHCVHETQAKKPPLPHLNQSLHFAHGESIKKLLKGQVVSQRLHSNTTYEHNYPVGARNDRLSVRICELYTCVYIAVACVYNVVYVLRIHLPRVCTLINNINRSANSWHMLW